MSSELICHNPTYSIGTDLGHDLFDWFASNEHSSVFIIADENTAKYCLPKITVQNISFDATRLFVIPAGEASKSLEKCSEIWKFMLESGADRKSVVICLGGGVVGDIGGFAASTFMRGIRFIQIPTSLLAMVDSSIGGKTGIDFLDVKNTIGTFHQPEAIFCNLSFLDTLTAQERLSGFAEMVKHALIDGGDHWKLMKTVNPGDIKDWMPLVKKSVRLKYQITQDDFKEKGLREVLNLGHTTAHALEALYFEKGQALLHGFAVAAGLAIEAELSSSISHGLSVEVKNEITNYIFSHFPKVHFSEDDIDRIVFFMGYDKKNRNGKRSFTLLRAPGEPNLGEQPSLEMIKKSLFFYFQHG